MKKILFLCIAMLLSSCSLHKTQNENYTIDNNACIFKSSDDIYHKSLDNNLTSSQVAPLLSRMRMMNKEIKYQFTTVDVLIRNHDEAVKISKNLQVSDSEYSEKLIKSLRDNSIVGIVGTSPMINSAVALHALEKTNKLSKPTRLYIKTSENCGKELKQLAKTKEIELIYVK